MNCIVEYRLAARVTAHDRLPLLAEGLGAMRDVQLVRGFAPLTTPAAPPEPRPTETSVDSRR
jgi:hypothetical protein